MAVTDRPGPREIPETEATGEVKAVFDDMKVSLRAPYVDLSFRVLAAYPEFLEIAWQQLKPNVTIVYFEECADEIRRRAVDATAGLGAPPRPEPVAADVLRVLHYVDPKLLLAVGAVRAAITGQYPLLQALPAAKKRQIPLGVPANASEIDEIDPDDAGERVAGIFDDMRATLGEDVVTSDFRALGRWPDYLGWAWQSLKPAMASSEYRSLQIELRRSAEAALAAFPFRLELGPHTLRLGGMDDRDIDNVRSIVDRFYALLPRRVLNVAFLSIGVEGQYGARRSPFPPQ